MKKVAQIFVGVCLAFGFPAIAPAQTITSQPQSVIVNNASTATFTVGASNATSYQWRFQGSNIVGATTSALTLEDVRSNQAGSYTVIVNSSVTSSNAVLTIVPGTIVTFYFSGLLTNGASSNMQVQLFDHDKPATVGNFIHYIRAGGYSNMFIDRCQPGFVVQGGDYGATDRTNTSSPITGWSIAGMFTHGSNQPNPPYPYQVDNEYNVGPVIHNRLGTIAMALGSGEPNSASSAFFFNLMDNSASLDSQEFTVFGRIIDANGTNVLQYFNSLNPGSGAVANEVFLANGMLNTNPFLNFLPVDYNGASLPANSNLVFCDFLLSSNAPVDTNPPTVSITSPAAPALLTNALQGTASDDVGLAVVICILTPQAAADGTYPYPATNGASVTNYNIGTTNWSISLNPGNYEVSVQAQDGAGNLSPASNITATMTAVLTNGNGTVSFTNGAFSNLDAVGYPFQIGSNYILSATPGIDQVFVSWASGGQTYPNPEISFDMGEGLLITANFTPATNAPLNLNIVGPGTVSGASNGEPILVGTTFQVTATPNPGQSFYAWNNGTETSLNPMQTYTMAGGLTLTALFITNNNSNLIAFTYPKANGLAGTNTLNITGTISNAASTPVSITCQVFSSTNLLAVTQPLETIGATNWTTAGTGLGLGSYILVATATDAAGDSTLISEDFSVAYAANLQLIIVGQGSVSPVTNGESLPIGTNFQVSATPGLGQVFYTWNNGTQISTNAVQTNTMAYGLTLTATFIPSNTAKGISFTYPAAKASLSTNTFSLKGKIASSMKSARVTCQFFQTNGLAVGLPMTTSATNNWAIGVTNLPGGIYMVIAQATNALGKSTIISEEFSVLPFAAVQGTYSGLFICTNSPVAPTNSGFLTFTLTPSGLMSGKLEFPAYPPAPIYSIPFENISFTLGFAEFSSTNFYGNPLLAAVYLNLTDGSDVAYGTISSKAWSSQLYCYRAVKTLSTNTTPPTGKYIFSLQPGNQTNGPNTNGYASVAVARDGAMALSGALPDNTTFSQSARVSKEGVWPLYVIPSGARNNEMLLGWEVFSNSGSCSGEVLWYKAPYTGSYYTGGVGVFSNMALSATGTNSSRPTANSRYSIVFAGGTIMPPLTNSLKVNNAGQFVVTGGPADKLKMSLSAGGVITGTMFDTNGGKTLRFNGSFISPAQGGSGFIPEANGQTGCFELKLAPP